MLSSCKDRTKDKFRKKTILRLIKFQKNSTLFVISLLKYVFNLTKFTLDGIHFENKTIIFKDSYKANSVCRN